MRRYLACRMARFSYRCAALLSSTSAQDPVHIDLGLSLHRLVKDLVHIGFESRSTSAWDLVHQLCESVHIGFGFSRYCDKMRLSDSVGFSMTESSFDDRRLYA